MATEHYEFTVVYERDEDGHVLAICPALQGCYAEGESQEEASVNIREAIAAHVASRQKLGEPIYPELGTERIALTV